MKLYFKQRFFSWFDSYDVYDESGMEVFAVKGELSWGHLLRIYGANGKELGCLKEKVFAWLPQFEMYLGDRYFGCLKKEFTFLGETTPEERNVTLQNDSWADLLLTAI